MIDYHAITGATLALVMIIFLFICMVLILRENDSLLHPLAIFPAMFICVFGSFFYLLLDKIFHF